MSATRCLSTVTVKVKVKFNLEQATKTQRGGVEVYLYSFLNLGARWGWVVNATPRTLYPRERLGTHCVGAWMGLRASLDRCGKSRPPPGFDPRTAQPVDLSTLLDVIESTEAFLLHPCI